MMGGAIIKSLLKGKYSGKNHCRRFRHRKLKEPKPSAWETTNRQP
jgi:hypothetical protein